MLWKVWKVIRGTEKSRKADILWSEFRYYIDISKDDTDRFAQWNFVIKGTLMYFVDVLR